MFWWLVPGGVVVLAPVLVWLARRSPKKQPGEMERVTLPHGLSVFAYNKGETDIIYKEVWEHNAYLGPPGKLTLQPGDTVFDVGANTGMFSLFAKEQCDGDVRVYAFEPVPDVHRILAANATEHFPEEPAQMHTFCFGLSDQAGEVTFLHHPQLSIWSTAHPEMDRRRSHQLYEDLPELTAFVLKTDAPRWLRWLPRPLVLWGARQIANAVVKTQELTCSLRTLSSVIREYNIDTIDILKIDVEGNELAVLQGIDEEHWPRIRQITMEVEDMATLEQVTSLLQKYGFAYQHEFTHIVHNSGIEAELSYLWAWRESE